MKVLVACEFSGIVREAFAAHGHNAWSCDLLPTEIPGNHYQCDVREVLYQGWDMLIAHPPCQFLSYAGCRWLKQPGRQEKMIQTFQFFMMFIQAPVPLICVENPSGYTGKWYLPPDQVIHPSQFGHSVTKETWLWLKDLPPLQPTVICQNPTPNWTSKGKFGHNAKNRSRTFIGIANAMASQWSNL